MKLKLESQSEITILTAFEQIGTKDVAILKAGLGKIFLSGRNSVLLDLSAIREGDILEPGVPIEIQNLQAWAHAQGNLLMIVGTAGQLAAACQASTREEGLQKFSSSASHLQLVHAKLTQELKTLETTRDELLKAASSSSGVSEQIRALRLENGELNAQIAELERILGGYTEAWAEPVSEALTGKAQTALKIMTSLLQKEGILP